MPDSTICMAVKMVEGALNAKARARLDQAARRGGLTGGFACRRTLKQRVRARRRIAAATECAPAGYRCRSQRGWRACNEAPVTASACKVVSGQAAAHRWRGAWVCSIRGGALAASLLVSCPENSPAFVANACRAWARPGVGVAVLRSRSRAATRARQHHCVNTLVSTRPLGQPRMDLRPATPTPGLQVTWSRAKKTAGTRAPKPPSAHPFVRGRWSGWVGRRAIRGCHRAGVGRAVLTQ